MYSQFGNCPSCQCSWDAGPIPEKNRQHYSPPYRFSSIRGIYCMDRDMTTHYQCPICQTNFKREEINREWPI